MTSRGHFDEAVEDDEEFREIGGKSSAKDIFLTLATDFLTEAPGLEHRFWNSARPNCEAPVLRSFVVELGALPQVVCFHCWRLWSGARGGSS